MSNSRPDGASARLVAAAAFALLATLLPISIVVAADTAPPTVDAPVLSPTTSIGGAPVTVTSTATDDVAVASAEVNVDGGPWTALSATGGSFGDASVGLAGSVGAAGVSTIAIGNYNGCALLGDALLRCWGQNAFGQFGEPTNIHRPAAVAIPGLSGVTAVGMGHWHACAILADATVHCWGNNFGGQLGDGTTAVHDGPVAVAGLSGAIALAAGFGHTCALLADTSVECWGINNAGELGDGSTTQRFHPVPVAGLSGVTALAAGSDTTCAILADTTVRCWGLNQSGQVGDGTTTLMYLTPVVVPGLIGVTAISARRGHVCALLQDATVRCWGENYAGQLGDGTTTDQLSPVAVTGLSGVTAVTAGESHTCALLEDATIRCWGSDASGALGDGAPTQTRLAPVAVAGLSGATAIGAGSEFTCALLADTTVRCWGFNGQGRLGDGTGVDRLSPTPVAGLAGALAGGTHDVCVRATDAQGNASDGSACATLTIRYGHTPIGSSIRVTFADETGGPSPVSATFDEVTATGESSISISSTGPSTPTSFVFGDPAVYYTLSTTATFTTATICIDFNGVSYADASELRMYHFVGGDWIEVTYTRDLPNTTVCGRVDSFSPFVVVHFRYGDTPIGESVEVTFADATGGASPVSATFDEVTAAGESSVSVSSEGPTPPATFQLGDPAVYYTLSTTATFSSATVCINFAGGAYYSDPTLLHLLHYEGGVWVDVTSMLEPWGGTICGVVSSFSPFVVAQLHYAFNGFFAPIDKQPVRNAAKAGGAIPIKFSLGGDSGLNIFEADYPKAVKVTCDTQTPLDEIEEIVPPGHSGLSYDAATGRYSYIWKTDSKWAGTCRQLVIRLADGTEHRANFTFRK